MFEFWVSIALLGLWSCAGVIYNNSRKASRHPSHFCGRQCELSASD
jgi:hypothetical protein